MKKAMVICFVSLLLLVVGFGNAFPEIPMEKISVKPDPVEGFSVDITTNRPVTRTFYPGEEIEFVFSATRDAYVVVYDVTPDGKVTILFPNAYDQDNFVKANVKVRIPREGYRLLVEDARGKEYVQIVACSVQFVTYHEWQQQFSHNAYPPVSGDAMDYFAKFQQKIDVVGDGPKILWASKIIYFYVK
ncbi:MAG TPA: DUF4384 domain-containing protein [Thermotogota bacterium]|nr:DUF4384 domain-containing protein [Thermotogota bacterium]HRW94006.1 DUF4384 domain-containing protein [Thermotogota bacterium]